jgi:hypothetical protein
MYCLYANQRFSSKFTGVIIVDYEPHWGYSFEGAMVIACSTSNLYLNCLIAYELFVLFTNHHNIKRHKPPTVRAITIQAMSVYGFSLLVFCFSMVMDTLAWNHEDKDVTQQLETSNLVVTSIITYVFPLCFFFGCWLLIKRRGYLPSAVGRKRELVLFFFRLVVLFCAIWLPGMLLINAGYSLFKQNLYQIGLIFCAFQPIVSFAMVIFSKKDVRMYVQKLVTFSYCRK